MPALESICPICNSLFSSTTLGGLCPNCVAKNNLNSTTASASVESEDDADFLVGSSPSKWVGKWIGNCEIIKEIARGGMGIVFQAHQAELDRIVALKIIRE